MRGKRGDVFQLILLLILLFVVALISLLSFGITRPIQQTIQGFMKENTTAHEINEKMIEQTPSVFDDLVFFLFLGGVIGLMVGAARTNFSPGVIFLFMLLTLFSVLISGGIVNIYHGFAQAPCLADVTSHLTLTNIIFNRHLPLITCILAGVIMFIMYSKSGNEIAL